ncbi:MAG: ArnT family glycosyltransferase [Planctomycetota bacterium]|jgi:4-amino-4-deoxy-L-arabinose transferase-like glycosyltransferase
MAAVVGIRATSPSNTYEHAQWKQIGVSIDTLQNGKWLLPRNQIGELARKPPLYAWLCAPVMAATGEYDELVFRVPTIAAALASCLLIYLMGRRWGGRGAGLLAGALWATMWSLAKMAYLATTDMLLAFWMVAAVFCADRVLFHPARRRGRWAVAFWASMILAALTKGWGIVNVPIIAAFVALASATQPGFKALRKVKGLATVGLLVRLVLRRWWQAIRRIRLGWGLLAMAAVLGPMLWAMWQHGGQEFMDVLLFEIGQRATGGGVSPPKPSSVPVIVHLIYRALPASIFAISALLLTPSRRWLSRGQAVSLPLCWLAAVVTPFMLAHGFRADYLLPCLGALAIMGAWAVIEVDRRGRAGGPMVGVLRHTIAAAPVVIGAALIVFPSLYLLGGQLSGAIRLPKPEWLEPQVWAAFWLMIPLGAVVLVMGIVSSLRWRIRTVAALACIGMLGVMFIDANLITGHARTRDGDKMRAFARDARETIGDAAYMPFMAENICFEPYMGRFDLDKLMVPSPDIVERLNASDDPWLVTCDRGLVTLGAATETPEGEYLVKIEGVKRRFETRPQELGEVSGVSKDVLWKRSGKLYLIRLKRPIRVTGEPVDTGYIRGYSEEEW